MLEAKVEIMISLVKNQVQDNWTQLNDKYIQLKQNSDSLVNDSGISRRQNPLLFI
jgi:uncharacterized protein YjiS (DUF1127 family)